jgi:hypothetical protein
MRNIHMRAKGKLFFAVMLAAAGGAFGASTSPSLKQEAAPTPGTEPKPPVVIWREKIEVASGGGYQGPWRMNESEYDYVDDPTVAIDAKGFVAVAWADQSRKDIFFQIYAPDGKSRLKQPVNVSRSPKIFSWLPRMVISGRDATEVYVLWQEIIFSGGSHGGEILFARSTDGGKTFGRPVNLSNSVAGDGKGRLDSRYWHNGSLDLVMGPQGNLYVAWTEYEGALWFRRSTDGGDNFSEPMRLAGGVGAKPARGPALAVGVEGTVYLAWAVGEDPTAAIHFAKSGDDGQSFGKPGIVFESGGHSDAPKIAVGRDGTVHVVYAQSPAGPFGRYHIRYTRSSDGGATFEEPREISSPQTKFESRHFPALSVDDEDNLYVLWERFPGRGSHALGLGFTYSNDGGRTFASPSVVPGSADPNLGINGSQQGLLMRKLAVNGAGAIAVVNSTLQRNETSRVWLFRGQAAGR